MVPAGPCPRPLPAASADAGARRARFRPGRNGRLVFLAMMSPALPRVRPLFHIRKKESRVFSSPARFFPIGSPASAAAPRIGGRGSPAGFCLFRSGGPWSARASPSPEESTGFALGRGRLRSLEIELGGGSAAEAVGAIGLDGDSAAIPFPAGAAARASALSEMREIGALEDPGGGVEARAVGRKTGIRHARPLPREGGGVTRAGPRQPPAPGAGLTGRPPAPRTSGAAAPGRPAGPPAAGMRRFRCAPPNSRR